MPRKKALLLAIDNDLIASLEKGDEELTDDLFYELLEESSDYLASPPFITRIREWMEAVYWDFPDEAEQARKNLVRIGTALAGKKPRGRPKKRKEPLYYTHRFEEICKKIDHFKKQEENGESISFQEAFPEWAHLPLYGHGKRRHRTTKALATKILSLETKIPVNILSSMIKEGSKITTRKRTPLPKR